MVGDALMLTKAGNFHDRCRSRHTDPLHPGRGGVMVVATPREPNGGSRPVPDPTALTQDAIDALRREINVQLDAAEKLTQDRFDGFQRQLDVAERLRLEQKVDTATAVTAALAAQKEQVAQQASAFAAETAKTERNFTEQLKGQRDTFGTAIAAQTTRYEDVRAELDRMRNDLVAIQSMKLGGQEQKATSNTTIGVIATIIGAVLGLLAYNAVTNDPAPADPVIVQVPAAETP